MSKGATASACSELPVLTRRNGGWFVVPVRYVERPVIENSPAPGLIPNVARLVVSVKVHGFANGFVMQLPPTVAGGFWLNSSDWNVGLKLFNRPAFPCRP